MHLPNSDYRPERNPEPPALVSVVSRSDVMWNRPVFKAPPLEATLPTFDPRSVAEELRRALRFAR
jgi:hypothetical protein